MKIECFVELNLDIFKIRNSCYCQQLKFHKIDIRLEIAAHILRNNNNKNTHLHNRQFTKYILFSNQRTSLATYLCIVRRFKFIMQIYFLYRYENSETNPELVIFDLSFESYPQNSVLLILNGLVFKTQRSRTRQSFQEQNVHQNSFKSQQKKNTLKTK